MSDLPPGTVFAGHRIEAVVGRGGMGVVYRATQLDLGRTVALKVVAPELLQDQTARKRFLQESRLAASIDHPHVIPIHYAGEEAGIPYLVMPYIVGDDGRGLVRREGPLAPERAARIVAQLAGALDAAHSAGLVHRDVKPANVLLAAGDHAYLSDFGLSRHVRSISGGTRTGQWVGTLDYVAPEQIRGGTVDARADVYALGCLLFFLLTGTVPFPRDDDEAKLWAHLTEPPPLPSAAGAPSPFDAVVTRALAKSPDERYPSAGDLGRAAEAAAAGRQVGQREAAVARGAAAPAEKPTRASSRRRQRLRRRFAVVGVLLTGTATAAVAAVVLLDGGAGKEQAVGTPVPTPTASPAPEGVVARVRWGSRPNSLVLTGDRVWVGAWRTDRLAAIDPTANRAMSELSPAARGGTVDMVLADDALWVLTRAQEVLRLDPHTGRPLNAPVPVTMEPAALAVRGSSVWVGEELPHGPAQIVRLNARTGAVEASLPVGLNISGMVYARRRLWTLHGEPNHLVARDPRTLEPRRNIALPGTSVGGLAYGAGALWVTITDQDQLVRFQPRTGDRASVSVGGRPIGVTVRRQRVWVASSGSSTIERVSAGSMKLVGERIPVPLNPLAIAISDDGIWVTCVGENVVARVALPS